MFCRVRIALSIATLGVADSRTLFFVDGIRAFKEASKTMSKHHALVQLESLYERGTRLYAKWCLRDEGLPRHLNERDRCFLVLFNHSILFGLRVQMLDWVPAAEVELVLADCLDRAVSYVAALQVVADAGIWQFQQDIASAKLAQFCGTMQEVSAARQRGSEAARRPGL